VTLFRQSIRNSASIPKALALTYFLFSTAWIVGTDLLVGISLHEELIHIGKGMLFVVVTTSLLYGLAKYHFNAATRTEKTLRHIFGQSLVGIVLLRMDGTALDCNDSFANFLGYGKNDLLSTSFRDWVHPDQLTEAENLWRTLLAENTPVRAERKYRRRDGQVVWGMLSASVIAANGKEPGFVVAMIEDINDAKRAHEALARSEARLRRLVQSDVIGISFWNVNGTFTSANNAFLNMVGYSQEELAKLNWSQISPPEFKRQDDDALRELTETGVFRSFEKEYIRKDGTRVPVMIGGALFEDASNEGVAFVLDLTSLRKAQQEIVRLARIVETTDDAVISLSLDGDILTWNRGAERLYGYKSLDIIGKSFTTLFPEDRGADAESLLETVKRGNTLDHLDANLLTRSGDLKPVSLTISPMRDSSGNLIGSSTMARDMTAHKHAQELERRFRQAQKLESLGRLAGGIAHDFNNILTVIGSYAQLAECELPSDHIVRNHTQQITKATERAAGLTRQMLAFSRKQMLAPKIVDLNEVIEETVGMVVRLIGEPIRVLFHPADHLWPISADPDQMTQVLLNLCVNARDAMPTGGRLIIETNNVEVNAGEKIANLAPGHYVMLAVADTGLGMTHEVQERIFEPFFTTKEVGKGTGLGLATVYGIVKQSGGDIILHSEPGDGSRFELYFPRVDELKLGDDENEADNSRGDETLLIVEDESALRDCMCHFFKQHGYNVLDAGSGEDADHVARSFGGVIDLLITDVIMPKMTGRQLAEKLTSIRPDLKTVLMSGYTDDIAQIDVLTPNLKFVQKPFSLNELAQVVREMLEEG